MSTCSTCLGAGWLALDVRPDDPRYGQTVRCACMRGHDRQRAFERASRYSDLTDEMREEMTFATWDSDRYPRACAAVRAWSEQPQGWVVLVGDTGGGKTHLLVGATQRLLATGHAAVYCIVPDLLAHLREQMSRNDLHALRIEHLQRVPVLLLDDLGAEHVTDWASEQLYRLLDYRYRSRMPTAIASNLDYQDWDARLRSRAWDARRSQVFKLTDDDYRLSDARARTGARDGHGVSGAARVAVPLPRVGRSRQTTGAR